MTKSSLTKTPHYLQIPPKKNLKSGYPAFLPWGDAEGTLRNRQTRQNLATLALINSA